MATTNLNALASSLATTTAPAQGQKKLQEAATQFEALMITQMMKTARDGNGGSWLSEGDETGEDSSMGMAEQQFAQSMASHGGLGLAKMVMRTMSRVEDNTSSSPEKLNHLVPASGQSK